MGIPRALLDQQATVKHYAMTEDAKGIPNRGVVSTTTYRCRLDSGSSLEEEGRQDTVTSLKVLILPAGSVIAPGDDVAVDGVDYAVVGEPDRLRAFGREHHVEANLRSVRDAEGWGE